MEYLCPRERSLPAPLPHAAAPEGGLTAQARTARGGTGNNVA
jgi:hypothetical protein